MWHRLLIDTVHIDEHNGIYLLSWPLKTDSSTNLSFVNNYPHNCYSNNYGSNNNKTLNKYSSKCGSNNNKLLRTFETRHLQRYQELFQLTIRLKMALFGQYIMRAMTA